MPRGNFMTLGRVLLMYWHTLTRLIRDLVFIQAADITQLVLSVPLCSRSSVQRSSKQTLSNQGK